MPCSSTYSSRPQFFRLLQCPHCDSELVMTSAVVPEYLSALPHAMLARRAHVYLVCSCLPNVVMMLAPVAPKFQLSSCSAALNLIRPSMSLEPGGDVHYNVSYCKLALPHAMLVRCVMLTDMLICSYAHASWLRSCSPDALMILDMLICSCLALR